MRIPKIYKREEDINSKKITYKTIAADCMEPVVFSPEVDFNDDKTVTKYVRAIKVLCRQSREYKSLMRFLKAKCEMNSCFFLPKVKKYHDIRLTIEMHHTGLVMEDIIRTVLKKRYAENETYDVLAVAEEVMYCHYKGMISITALSATLHDLIHEDEGALFIPLGMEDFGDTTQFVDVYKEYIDKEMLSRFNQYVAISSLVVNIEDIIPDYLNINILYYTKEGVEVPDMEKVLEIMKDVKFTN